MAGARARIARLGLGAGLALALAACGGERDNSQGEQQTGPSFKLVPQLAALEDKPEPAADAPADAAAPGILTLAPGPFAEAMAKDGVHLIDVRTPEEYAQGHIEGATLIPLGEFDPAAIDIGDATRVILYCRSDRRSGAAAQRWAAARAEPVAHLEGGILAWEAEGLPVTQP